METRRLDLDDLAEVLNAEAAAAAAAAPTMAEIVDLLAVEVERPRSEEELAHERLVEMAAASYRAEGCDRLEAFARGSVVAAKFERAHPEEADWWLRQDPAWQQRSVARWRTLVRRRAQRLDTCRPHGARRALRSRRRRSSVTRQRGRSSRGSPRRSADDDPPSDPVADRRPR